ncbi:hypothetical protein CIT292_07165 [Citrobacter youngae ATCC 29220]|uniref:Uncharacterized protein n=1 Tax=Citrobacter youngae ATCC 29220 TaxID=500640 RepID=D4B9M5_9ENTR|nr:hypothetical protein CIT292_07165 [Citrobacter youngae ATCC 29220]
MKLLYERFAVVIPHGLLLLRLRQNGRVIRFSLISTKIDILQRRLKALTVWERFQCIKERN